MAKGLFIPYYEFAIGNLNPPYSYPPDVPIDTQNALLDEINTNNLVHPWSGTQAKSNVTTLVNMRSAYPNVPISIVVNGGADGAYWHGAGSIYDADFHSAMQTLRNAGIKIYGYIDPTVYTVDLNSSKEKVDHWYSMYGDILDGIFLDDYAVSDYVPDWPYLSLAYYDDLNQYIRTKRNSTQPGVTPLICGNINGWWNGSRDNENAAYFSSPNAPDFWLVAESIINDYYMNPAGVPINKKWALLYNTPSSSMTDVQFNTMMQSVDWVVISERNYATYQFLPNWLDRQASLLSELNKNITSKTQTGKSNIVSSLVVKNKTQSGKADIKASKSKTQNGLANVIQAITGTQKTISGKANIKNTTTKSISGKSDVKIQVTKTISGISKVSTGKVQEISGKASVITSKTQNITGKASIFSSFVSENWNSYSTGTTSWAGWASKLNGLKVSNGTVVSSSSSNPAVAYYSGKTFPANQYSKVQVVNKSGAGAVVRCGTGQYYYGIVCDTTTNTIYLRIYNGQYTHSNISTKQYTINVGDYLEVRIADGYITGLVNNSVVMGPYADPGLATSGSPGIVINSSTTGSVDNWTGGELPFSKTITGKSNITEYVPFLKVTDRFDTLDNWTTITGKTAFTLSANSISTGNNVDAAMFYSAGSFSKAQYAEARINLYASTCAGYILLRVNGSSWYQAKITLTGIYIQKVVNGAAPVNIGSYLDLSSYTDIGSCKWKFCISVTNELIVYKNGVFFSSWGTDTSIASGSPGLRILGTSAFGPGAIDSFEAGNYGPVKQTEISGRANIAFLQSRSTYGQSKVTRIEAKAQSGRSSIIKKVSQAQTGKARVGKTSIKTIDGKSRINVINNKTITATSRINKLHIEEQSGKSSIKNTVKSVINGKSSILVEYMLQRSMQGKASIKKTVTKQINAISRIIVKNVRTITAKSSIKKSINISQNGTANVTVEMKHSQHGMSAIISLLNKNMCGKANIVTIVPSISLLSSLPAMLEITSNITDKNAVRLLGKYGITTMEVIDNRKGAIRIQTSEGIKSIKQVNNK